MNTQQLKVHKKSVHMKEKQNVDETYPCPECQISFTTRKRVMRHMNRNGHLPYKCSDCPKNFSDTQMLERHSQLHDQQRQFQCDICNYRYTNMSMLLRHRKTCHAENAVEA